MSGVSVIFVALGAFIVGAGFSAFIFHKALLIGFQLGCDDARLDPGDTVGQLPSALPEETPEETTGPIEVVVAEPVGESSGRHALPPEFEKTVVLPAVHREVQA